MEMESNQKTILYMTVNTVNNKIYIGIHITSDPYKFDNYWGDGITGTGSYHFKHPSNPFQRACKKYGLDAFKRYTLHVFDNYDDARKAEALIVDEEFIKRPDTYNVALGGGCGLVPSVEKEVFQYDLEGNFIKGYRSQQAAARELKLRSTEISRAVITKSICHNFYWSESKVFKLDVTGFTKPRNRKVYIYKLSGDFDSEYDTISDASTALDVTTGIIQKAAKNQYKCSGYYVSFEKLDFFKKEKKKKVRAKCLYMYALDGTFIRQVTFQEAKSICGEAYKRLHNAINEQYSCAGYLWSREFVECMKSLRGIAERKIEQYDLSGNLVKVWDSYGECRRAYSHAKQVIEGRRSQTKGFVFKYKIEND